MDPIGLFFVAAGAFTICGAALNWEWFFNSRKAKFFVAILGRKGARIFYTVLGTGILVFGVLFTCGLLKNAS